jgi:hypothetical protein
MTTTHVAALPFERHERRFGDVLIWWEAPAGFQPVALDLDRANGRQVFITQVDIHYEIGAWVRKTIKAGFRCDGASIPRPFWRIPGFHPLGWHFWATLIHDYACEHPEEIKRTIGDVLFHEILLALRPEKRLTAFAMSSGVKSMTCYLAWKARLPMATKRINWTPVHLILILAAIVAALALFLFATSSHGQTPQPIAAAQPVMPQPGPDRQIQVDPAPAPQQAPAYLVPSRKFDVTIYVDETGKQRVLGITMPGQATPEEYRLAAAYLTDCANRWDALIAARNQTAEQTGRPLPPRGLPEVMPQQTSPYMTINRLP